jgi:cytochrome b6-f complex iron-sulfur subunit
VVKDNDALVTPSHRRFSLVDSTTPTPTSPADAALVHEACLPEHCATRRSVLIGAGVVGAAALAGCGSKSSTAAATTSAAGAAAPAASALAQLSDIPVGTAIAAKNNGKPIIIAQPTAGEVKAFSAICTHMGCTVAPSSSGQELDCPCHGSKYSASTGAVIGGPAPKPLPAVAVKVVNGSVVPA